MSACGGTTHRGDKFVTGVIDLTPVRDRTGPARSLDMVKGRSKQVFKTRLSQRPGTWRTAVEVVAMDGFTGFKTATVEELSASVEVVMGPFHDTAMRRTVRRVVLWVSAPMTPKPSWI